MSGRDYSSNGIFFKSYLLAPYLKDAKNGEELLPWFLYLQGYLQR
ncbi:MAG: hypothetical protein ACTS73_06405 [Arsenophonus sp. NEOnobi-MAG3]